MNGSRWKARKVIFAFDGPKCSTARFSGFGDPRLSHDPDANHPSNRLGRREVWCEIARQAEVEEPGPIFRADPDVGRLDVAMKNCISRDLLRKLKMLVSNE